MAGMPAYAMLSFSLTASLLAFLVFNYHPAKIFMGDSGSLIVGLVNAILVVKFIAAADSKGVHLPLTASVAIGFSILIVPLLDTLRVFSIRIFKGRSPFAPDRNHIHHLLLDRGLNHSHVTLSCVCLNIAFIAMAYFGRSLGSTIVISSMILTWFGLIGILIYYWKPVSKLVVAKSFHSQLEPGIHSGTKIVSMNTESAVLEQQP
jgi:UDP-N-acetylmuramyl pentapeptide phosphotransferase/UDP-N-acetylglucosamine-1-phosphate transferase